MRLKHRLEKYVALLLHWGRTGREGRNSIHQPWSELPCSPCELFTGSLAGHAVIAISGIKRGDFKLTGRTLPRNGLAAFAEHEREMNSWRTTAARMDTAQARAVATYAAAVTAARAAGALSLGDCAQALQGARFLVSRGRDR